MSDKRLLTVNVNLKTKLYSITLKNATEMNHKCYFNPLVCRYKIFS